MRTLLLCIALFQLPVWAGDEVKLPQTVEEYTSISKSYKDKAAQYRAEVSLHRQMIAEAKKAYPDLKGGRPNPAATKMEKHCTAIIKAAEALAAESDRAAEFYSLRAKEIAGEKPGTTN